MRNTNHVFTKSALFLLSTSVLLFSCKKENISDAEKEAKLGEAVEVSVSHNAAIQPFNDVYTVVLGQFDELANDLLRLQNGRPAGAADVQGNGCYTTTISPSKIDQWPKTVTRNFDPLCVGADGKNRSGKIISVFSSPIYNTGATVTTSFDDYVVDSFAITGTMTITNAFTYKPDTSYAIKVDLTDAKATHRRTEMWSKVNGQIVYTQQKRTPNYFTLFAPFYTTGVLNGENSFNLTWKAEVTKPILRNFECLWPVSGVLSLQWLDNKDKASIDYGNGDCDNKAQLSYKGLSMQINM